MSRLAAQLVSSGTPSNDEGTLHITSPQLNTNLRAINETPNKLAQSYQASTEMPGSPTLGNKNLKKIDNFRVVVSSTGGVE